MQAIRDVLERYQAWIYFAAVALAAACGIAFDGASRWEQAINPALALMLYVTFLQVPLSALRSAFAQKRFLGALLVTNFVAVPLLVLLLGSFLPSDQLLRFGALLVLLAPCIDYVVTFAHMGKADAHLLLACTPVLLLVQMALLPVYLTFALGAEAATLVQAGPFIDAFIWLIAVPLLLAACTQKWGQQSTCGVRIQAGLGLLAVPATALVLFVVIASALPQLVGARAAVWAVLPIYIAFAVTAPLVAWAVARWFQLAPSAVRAVAFSGSTRNSLVVLPLALAAPEGVAVLSAVIIAQTLVELVSELVYVKLIARMH